MRKSRRLAVLGAALITAMVAHSASAMAATAPGYEEFSACPSRNVDSTISACITSKVTGGYLQLGTKNTPITDPITLTGSVTSTAGFIVGEFDGGRQQVPGGIVGITGLNWLINLFPGSLLKLYAEAELAGNPTNPNINPFQLPLKVNLQNPLLANGCYIGSDSSPIQLNLTRGTTAPPPPNQPISGANGTAAPDPSLAGVIRIADRVYVDNAFAVPEADGCDMLLPGIGVIDHLVNWQAGLPAAAGTNTAVQEAEGAVGGITFIYPPTGFES